MVLKNFKHLFFCILIVPFTLNTGLAEESEAWDDIREFLFQDRPIKDGSEFLRLDMPQRPPNGGDVTVNIVSSYPQNEKQFIAKHYLVVDKNPSPVAGQFILSDKNGTANIATRIRVNEYSNVRLISENEKGELYMTSLFVKASGGCSAPPMNTDGMSLLEMGKMRLIQEESIGSDQPGRFQLSILHPSYSGLQKDQVTLYFIPPHYVESVEVKNSQGDTVFAAHGDISFSENPSFDFFYRPVSENDSLTVKIIDSKQKVYQSEWVVSRA